MIIMRTSLRAWADTTVSTARGVGVLARFAVAYLWTLRPDRPHRTHKRTFES